MTRAHRAPIRPPQPGAATRQGAGGHRRAAWRGCDSHQGRGSPKLGAGRFDMAAHLRTGLLRHRNDAGLCDPLRHGSYGHHPPGHSPAARLHHRGRTGHDQDRADCAPPVGADARAKVRDFHGVVRDVWGPVLLRQLLDPQGHRPGHSRRRLRPGLSAAARGADRGLPQTAGQDQERTVPPPARRQSRRRGGRDADLAPMALLTDELMLNMGPQHPSTHGVLRMVVTLDGENIVDVQPDIGYLHSSVANMMENGTYLQNIALVDRGMDYLSAMANEEVWVLACERLGKIGVPERAR